jgi:hypothetical protein
MEHVHCHGARGSLKSAPNIRKTAVKPFCACSTSTAFGGAGSGSTERSSSPKASGWDMGDIVHIGAVQLA